MQLGRVRWANAELLACQAKDAMRRLKLTTFKLRLTREKKPGWDRVKLFRASQSSVKHKEAVLTSNQSPV